MSETTLTHKELGRMLGVSETTIKSYRRKFPDCIPVANEGKPIRFTQEAGKICLRIRELFSRGMAVPEVRARLEKEFSWVGPAPVEPAASEDLPAVTPAASVVPSGPVEVELPQDYTLAMSSLAKSMVNLSMKQDAIMRKMESIDSRLKQLGLQGVDASKATAEATAEVSVGGALPPEMSTWLEQASNLLERLEQQNMHAEATGEATGATPAQHDDAQQEKTHGKLVRIRNAYGEVNEYTVETEAAVAGSASAIDSGGIGGATSQVPGDGDNSDGNGFIFDSEEGHSGSTVEPSAPREQAPDDRVDHSYTTQQEPPRALLTIPLVIQSPDGEFLGVAGRTRGRFCINDLKAMLMNHYEGTQRYSSHWQLTENGWLMTLEQKEATDPHTLAMLVEKTTTPRGNDVSLIEHLTINGRDENPVEMYNFINKIYES